MSFVLDPEGLAPEVYPLAWLVGTWRGEGVVDYPGIDEATFTQEIVIASDGGPYLSYTSTIRLSPRRPTRRALGRRAARAGLADRVRLLAHPARAAHRPGASPTTSTRSSCSSRTRPATSRVYIGAVGKGRIDLVSDAIVRTASRAPTSAPAKRLYGLVNGELMWAHDIAAFGHPMQSYASGRLARVEALTDDEA